MKKMARIFTVFFLSILVLSCFLGKGFCIPEDFDTYTTVGQVVTDGVRLNATLNLDGDDYAYYDYGAGYFDDFEHYFNCLINGSAGGTTRLGNVWLMANITEDEKGIRDAASQTYLAVDLITVDSGTTWSFRLKYWNDVALIKDTYVGVTYLAMYYLTVNRTGTDMFCEIYSDFLRTNLLDKLTITVTTGVYRMIYGCNSYDQATARYIQVMVENLDFSPDIAGPQYILMGLNSTLNGSGIQLTINLTDNIGLDFCLLEWNNTGSFLNVSLSISGTNQLCLFNQTLNATSGIRVNYRFFFNDTANNWHQTVLHFLYTNTEPIIVVGEGFLIMGVFFLCGVFCIIGYIAYSKH